MKATTSCHLNAESQCSVIFMYSSALLLWVNAESKHKSRMICSPLTHSKITDGNFPIRRMLGIPQRLVQLLTVSSYRSPPVRTSENPTQPVQTGCVDASSSRRALLSSGRSDAPGSPYLLVLCCSEMLLTGSAPARKNTRANGHSTATPHITAEPSKGSWEIE